MHRVHVQQSFTRPVSEIFEHLAEHEHLEPVFGAKVARVRDGDDGHRNGAGSVRRLRVGPLPAFEETVTEYVPGELIRYRITKGSPLKDHEGVMRFSPRGTGSHLEYTITFDGKLPGVGAIVRTMLDRNISRALKRLG
jgi:uncharacterized protein YndB with AHSA1/START domain